MRDSTRSGTSGRQRRRLSRTRSTHRDMPSSSTRFKSRDCREWLPRTAPRAKSAFRAGLQRCTQPPPLVLPLVTTAQRWSTRISKPMTSRGGSISISSTRKGVRPPCSSVAFRTCCAPSCSPLRRSQRMPSATQRGGQPCCRSTASNRTSRKPSSLDASEAKAPAQSSSQGDGVGTSAKTSRRRWPLKLASFRRHALSARCRSTALAPSSSARVAAARTCRKRSSKAIQTSLGYCTKVVLEWV
mmetsp:Transcript_62336/g.136461  ORF Transcript_62336/g.136461 Transcript_62336/m.136461 type:complete len:243 (+) Transcript_62336:48-776(+)